MPAKLNYEEVKNFFLSKNVEFLDKEYINSHFKHAAQCKICNLEEKAFFCNETYGQLYQETMNRIKLFIDNGYNVIYIWEEDFKKQLKEAKKAEKLNAE